MQIIYIWKYISQDGLLKEPKEFRFNYYDKSINEDEDLKIGFLSKADAIENFKKFEKYLDNENYILVEIYKQ